MNGYLAPYYHHPEIVEVIDLWIGDGYKSYHDLSDGIKEQLALLCMKHLGTDAYSCIIEPDNFTQTLHHLMKYMETGQKEYALDLAETMNKNAVEYFSDALSELFDERYADHEADIMHEAGFVTHQDRDNGEIRWVKRY